MAQGSNPEGDEIFQTCPDWLQAPPSLLYNGYWVSFQGAKQMCVALTPTPFQSQGWEWVELYLYFPLLPAWHVIGLLPLSLICIWSQISMSGCHRLSCYVQSQIRSNDGKLMPQDATTSV